MHILALEAENFKRLRAVRIEPNGPMVEITGRNAQGKTSVLDAIWAALGGKDAAPRKPIRDGQDEARIMLDLGELKVIRKFKATEEGAFTTTLVVESAEGARFPSPQGVLDALVGALTFDPMAFLRMAGKEQFATCRAFVPGVDFDSIEGLNRRDFENRTEVGRRLRDLKGQKAALPALEGDAPEWIDPKPLEDQLAEAGAHNTHVAQRQAARDAAVERIGAIDAQIARLGEERAELQTKIDQAPKLPAPIDTVKVREKLEETRRNNEMAQEAKSRTALDEKIKLAEGEEATLTASIKARTEGAAAEVAKAKMPVEGLGFGDGIVLLAGVPFDQASDAEQLRASIAIAAAMNPRLKIVRVRDGSLLDPKGFKILEAFAAKHDLQVWIETVASGRSHAVLIENGEVASAPAAAATGGEIL